MARDFDVVLFGAAGFVGRHAARYFAKVGETSRLRWAIAGRSREKLEAVKRAASAPADVEVLVADALDRTAVGALAARTRVLLNMAGPFALYGDAIVDACVAAGTHYADITGETPWVRSLIDRHHAKAAADGTRIVPCCGFDSVPSDLGVYLAVRQLQRRSSSPCRAVKGYFQLHGGFNGGTIATAFLLYESGQARRARDPFLLDGDRPHSASEIEAARDPIKPQHDPDIDAWVGPFVMGPVNTRVVRRSAALFDEAGQTYGPNFTYQEFARYSGTFARNKATSAAVVSGLFDRAVRSPTGRRLLRTVLPKPGAGPSDKVLDSGWYRCEVRATSDDGTTARVLFTDKRDPGNRATALLACESALCLAQDLDALPGTSQRGGVLTPATAFGDRLVDRLLTAGVTITVT